MNDKYDCIVIGAGGFGSSALYHLARKGVRALGIERFGIAHDRGSSHGETRVIRKAYFEHVDYVPLVLRAYDLWHDLEVQSGRRLYHQTGLLIAGLADQQAITGTLYAARQHDLSVERLTPQETQQRYPAFHIPENCSVVIENEAGYLDVEQCIATQVQEAQRHGAELKTDETVKGWKSDGTSVQVFTDKGQYQSAALIVTAGAWTAQILTQLGLPLTVLRKVLFWHDAPAEPFDTAAGNVCFYLETPEGCFYGLPRLDGLVKLAEHSGGRPVSDPSQLDRNLYPEDVESVAKFLDHYLPALAAEPTRHAVCMYTNTPDGNFIVDLHPEHANVAIGAGFSGHGFKFTAAIGEVLTELALERRTSQPIDFLSIGRPALKTNR